MGDSSLSISNTASMATDIDVFTAKDITIDGAVYKAHHTTEGFKVPIVFSVPTESNDDNCTYLKNKACYILLPKEEIIKCLKEYLPEIIDSSVLKDI